VSDPRFPDGGWRPNESQALLLRAALLDREPALAAWREWSRRETIETTDLPSSRLAGLVCRNLDAHGVEHHTMPKLRGAYRYIWFKNQTLLRNTAPALRALHEAGIPTLLLKGASLSALHYRDWGVREMGDVDVLVPPYRALDAIAVLRGTGAEPSCARVEESIYVQHGDSFKHGNGWNLDLHWFSLWRSSSDVSLWEHAVPLELCGERTLAPAPTHQLMHVCTHGAQYNESTPIRWIADAWTVLQTNEVDWELFEREARERLLTVVLASALNYLRDLVDAPIPNEVVRRLEAAPSPRFERIGFRATAKPFGPVRTALMLWERYRRLSVLRPPGPRPGFFRGFYGFLSLSWGVERPWQFPKEAMRHFAASRSGT
jgi:hypothetical protein